MSEVYSQLVADLQNEVIAGKANPKAIDAAVAEIMSTDSPRIARDLLSCLSDRASYDAGMFSLIHAAESFDDLNLCKSSVISI